MLILPTLWWLFFWTALGLCVGSFLNAIIHRLPRNQTIREPRWSACPSCKHRIFWYDNIPLISFILLRGRCRNCRVPISTRYVVIEAAMALIVLMLLDAFFVGHVREGLLDSPFGLTDVLAADWPILLAHIILFACLLPMSVIDLEHYWVDIRFTNFATLAGFGLHAIWTPRHARAWIRPDDSTAMVSLFALAGLGITWIWLICQPHVEPEKLEEPTTPPPVEPPGPVGFRRQPPSLASPSRLAGWLAISLMIALLTALMLDAGFGVNLRHPGRGLLPLFFFFALVVWESTVNRPADQEIVDALDSEKPLARRMVLGELAVFLPCIAAGAIGWWVMNRTTGVADGLSAAVHFQVRLGDAPLLRGWSPVFGLATAASGYLISGALGWFVRIAFTLLFGKEAFGSGDIHLMAAAGCVAGWPVVLLGFFLTVVLALLGWVLALPFKRSHALPLGPWLSLSFLTVALFHDSILRWPFIERLITVVDVLILDNSQVLPFESFR